MHHRSAWNRRDFLAAGAAGLATFWTVGGARARTNRAVAWADDPFSLGVASGDPTDSGVVLWTRLAPRPFEPGGGMGPGRVDVEWEVAEDEAMTRVVRRGSATATPQLGHSVHVEVDGLRPDRWYWYRFRSGEAQAEVGRTRTLPEPAALPDRMRLAFASCQHFEAGYYTAYKQMAADDLDLVVHLGDYIYEGPGRDVGVRKHLGGECMSLGDYRVRYAQYRADPHLRGMHARCPWFVTWDDHEVDNNYAGRISEIKDVDPDAFLRRREDAYQAYYEMMPLRRSAIPRGPDMRIYRDAEFGRLAHLAILDTRQYRTDQPNGDRRAPLNDAAKAPTNSLLGHDQKGWLKASLLGSPAVWNVLAQQVMMATMDLTAGADANYAMDQWPGAVRERDDLMRFLADRRVSNPVVLTGDIHSNWVNALRVDDLDPGSPVVASEFVGTSISSGGNGSAESPREAALKSENPGLRFYNNQRGYVRCTATPGRWQADYVVVEAVTTPDAPALTRASFVVEDGRPGPERA